MKLTQKKIEIGALAQENLDLKKVLGIVVAGNTAYLQTLDLPTKIAEKMTMAVPAMQELPTSGPVTSIKSVQCKSGLIVAEVEGPLTTAVKNAVDTIVAKMTKANMVTGFFPGNNAKAQTQYYFGFTAASNLRNVAKGIINVRLNDTGSGIIFTQATQMKQIDLSQINGNWSKEATILYETNKAIAFLGRVQKNQVVLTLSDDTTFIANIERRKATVVRMANFKEKVTAFFGTVQNAGTSLLAAARGQELILIPTAVNQ